VNRVAANFIVFALASVGAFIALVTGIAHAGGVELPCGGVQSGCDVIALRENSHWLGVPIAFYGLALYLVVAFLSMFRAAIGIENSPRLGSAIWALLAAGGVVSVGLMAHAILNLHATCLWCLASAIVMVAAFFIHTYGLSRKTEGKAPPFAAFMGILALAVVAGTAYGFSLKGEAAAPTFTEKNAPAYHEDDPFLGNPKAPVVITEFTDLYCPTCRSQHAWFLSNLGEYLKNGKLKLVVRHYPLPDLHPLAIEAALFTLVAQEKGKFWDLFQAVHQIDVNDDRGLLLNAVKSVGMDPKSVDALIKDKEKRKKYVDALQKDIDEGSKLGVESTPSWFVDYPDGKRQFAVGSGIQRLVGDPLFQEAIK
jgi:protein-disulfide isomerase